MLIITAAITLFLFCIYKAMQENCLLDDSFIGVIEVLIFRAIHLAWLVGIVAIVYMLVC